MLATNRRRHVFQSPLLLHAVTLSARSPPHPRLPRFGTADPATGLSQLSASHVAFLVRSPAEPRPCEPARFALARACVS